MVKNNLQSIRMQAPYMMNKKEFAQQIDVAEKQYLRYESGAIMPTLELCLRIAKKLNMPVEDIWFLQEN